MELREWVKVPGCKPDENVNALQCLNEAELDRLAERVMKAKARLKSKREDILNRVRTAGQPVLVDLGPNHARKAGISLGAAILEDHVRVQLVDEPLPILVQADRLTPACVTFVTDLRTVSTDAK